MVEGGRRGGDNKTEESEITMQDEEGMMRKKGSEMEYGMIMVKKKAHEGQR